MPSRDRATALVNELIKMIDHRIEAKQRPTITNDILHFNERKEQLVSLLSTLEIAPHAPSAEVRPEEDQSSGSH